MKAAAKRNLTRQQILEQAGRMLAEDGSHEEPEQHLLRRMHHASNMVLKYGLMLAMMDDEAEASVEAGEQRRRGWAYKEWVPDESERGGHLETRIDPLLAAGRDKYHVHPFVTEFNFWCSEHAKFSKMCADLGIKERLVTIAEDQSKVFLQLMQAYAKAAGLTPEQQELGQSAVREEIGKMRLIEGGTA